MSFPLYLKTFIKTIDLFGEPIRFSFNQHQIQKSFFGGITTLVLLCVFVSIAFQGFLSIINKDNITAYTTEIYSTQPPYIDVSPENMNWAVTFTPNTMNIWNGDGKYFKLEVYEGIYTRDVNGNLKKSRRLLNLEPCVLDSFNPNEQIVLMGLTNNISSFLCPKQNEKLALEGKFSSQNFSFINFQISKCRNSSSNTTCASQDAIDKVFKDAQNKVYLNIFIRNNIMNIYDFNTPVSTFLDDRTYLLIDPERYKEKNFYLTLQKIYTDDSILTTSYKEDANAFSYDNNFDETELPLANDLLGSVYFRSNFLAKNHFRTFEKIGRFISYIGGFWSVLFLFFSIIGNKYNKYCLLIKMANELYDFESKNYKKAKTKNQFWQRLIPKRKNDPYQLKMVDIKNESMSKSLNLYIRKKHEFKLTTSLRYLFKCLFRKEEKTNFGMQENLRKLAFMEIYKEVDIIHLLKKIKQIDKIKTLLLTEPQRILFEFNHKTVINDSKYEMKKSSLKFAKKIRSRKMSSKKVKKQSKYDEGVQDIKEFYHAYLALKKEQHEQKEQHENYNIDLNEKIITFIDLDLLQIFRKNWENMKKSQTRHIYFSKSETILNPMIENENCEKDDKSENFDKKPIADKSILKKNFFL